MEWEDCLICFSQLADNSTTDLEVRVTLLEDDVADLERDVEELRTDNTLQDERLNTIEETVAENANDIDGKWSLHHFDVKAIWIIKYT